MSSPAPHLLRLPEVLLRCGMKRSSIYRFMQEGAFPRPIHIGTRAVAWPEADVNAWIRDRIAAARGDAAETTNAAGRQGE